MQDTIDVKLLKNIFYEGFITSIVYYAYTNYLHLSIFKQLHFKILYLKILIFQTFKNFLKALPLKSLEETT